MSNTERSPGGSSTSYSIQQISQSLLRSALAHLEADLIRCKGEDLIDIAEWMHRLESEHPSVANVLKEKILALGGKEDGPALKDSLHAAL